MRYFNVCLLLILGLAVVSCENRILIDPVEDLSTQFHTVTFQTNGGTPVPPQEVAENGLVVLPDTPTRDGWKFLRWFQDEQLITPWSWFFSRIQSDTTIYAGWIKAELDPVTNRDMVTIPGGDYNQQAANGHMFVLGQEFLHTLDDFQIGAYQVTWELWKTVYDWAGNNDYQFVNAGQPGSHGVTNQEITPTNHIQPVVGISWFDVITWLNAYSEMHDFQPVYTHDDAILRDATQLTPDSLVTADWQANGFRLPTEGEWQFAAARQAGNIFTPATHAAGSGEPVPGNDSPLTPQEGTKAVAWYYHNTFDPIAEDWFTQLVGGKNPTALGLYDMSGNVWEWCWDLFGSYPETATNYRGPETGNSEHERVIRGGSFYEYPSEVAIGRRNRLPPLVFYNYDQDYLDVGFRVARRR